MYASISRRECAHLCGGELKEVTLQHEDVADAPVFAALRGPPTFSIGPLTSSELWNGARADMSLDRPPCEYSVLTGHYAY